MRRKLTCTLFLIFCLSGLSFAQPAGPGVGIRVGLNLADVRGENSDESSTLTGFHIGLFTGFPLTRSLSIQTEMLYTRKGSRLIGVFDEEVDELFADAEGRFQLDYLEIPLLLRLDLATGAGIRPHFVVGPTLGLNVRAVLMGSVLGMGFSVDLKDEIANMELGLAAGAGVGFNVSPRNVLSLGVRYNRGLTTIDSGGDFDNFNSVISVTSGLSF